MATPLTDKYVAKRDHLQPNKKIVYWPTEDFIAFACRLEESHARLLKALNRLQPNKKIVYWPTEDFIAFACRLEESHARLLKALIAGLHDSGCDGDLCARQWHEDASGAIAAAEQIE